MKPKTIDKVETYTIKFCTEDGGFKVFINGKDVMGGFIAPIDEHKKIARTLSRIATHEWAHIDLYLNKLIEDEED